jgi:creatinine amidohydrolase
MTLIQFPDLISPDAPKLANAGRTIGVMVLGAIEQHGPHLPLATDFVIAQHLASAVADRIADQVVLAPVLPGGCSSHHLAFPGTVDLPEEVVRGYVVAYVAAFSKLGIDDVALMSSHGGNFSLMGQIARDHPGDDGGPRVIAYDDLTRYLAVMRHAATTAGLDVPETDAHAGGLETSQMLYLRGAEAITVPPGLEGYVEAEDGWLDTLLNEGVHALSPIGVLGRPDGATAAAGEAICRGLADELAAWIAGEFGVALVNKRPAGASSLAPAS